MKRVFHTCGARLIAGALLAGMLCGCDGTDGSAALFFDFVQTVLLAVTAAGSVFIIREV